MTGRRSPGGRASRSGTRTHRGRGRCTGIRRFALPAASARERVGDPQRREAAPDPGGGTGAGGHGGEEAEPLFEQVLLGSLTPKEFLDRFAARLTEAQGKYLKRTGCLMRGPLPPGPAHPVPVPGGPG